MNAAARNHYSFANQPDIVAVSDVDDNTNTTKGSYSSFTVTYPTPIIEPKSCALVHASIPMAKQQIPEYCCVFWYYKAPDNERAAKNLKAIRFLPFGRLVNTALAVNRYITSYADFVSLLNMAANSDDSTNPAFAGVGDVTFALNGKQIVMTGADSTLNYCPAAYDDPNIPVVAATLSLPGVPADINNYRVYVPNQTLNLRVGFSQPNKYVDIVPSLAWAPGGQPIFPDSFPNLVYTSTVRLYSNLASSAGLNSNGARNLVAVVPVNAPALGVVQYEPPKFTYLKKVPDTIYSITVEMYDDQNQPFSLPDNAATVIQLVFTY